MSESEDRLSPEDEQCLIEALRPRGLSGQAPIIDAAIAELLLAWRVRSALGWQTWPSEAELKRMEAAQERMRREYEADIARDAQ